MRLPRCTPSRLAALRCASRLNGVLLCIMSLGAVSGCNRGPQFGEVSGTVTLNGKPLSDLEVVFLPDPKDTSGPTSTAYTNEKGHYQLVTNKGQRGAVVGTQRLSNELSPRRIPVGRTRPARD